MAQFISCSDAAKRLGVTRMTIWKWLHAPDERRLRGEQIGHTWVVDAEDLGRVAEAYKPRKARVGTQKRLDSVTS